MAFVPREFANFYPECDNRTEDSFVRPYDEKPDIADILGIVFMFSISIAGFLTAVYFDNKSKNKIDQPQKEIRQIETIKQNSIINYQTQYHR